VRTISRTVAQWLTELKSDQIPAAVVDETKLRILDIVGAMLGGRDTELVEQAQRALFIPDNGSGTPVVGFDRKTGVATAALLQGTMGCVLEFDDSHVATGIHASTPVVAASLAKGQQLDISGRALIESVLVGNELTCRLGLVAPGMFHRSGFHPTGVLAVFGAAYALSRMLGARPDEIVNAIGICGSLSSGIMASWEDGSSAKSLHAGWAASSAIQAVSLAQQGVSGPVTAYEGRFGFFRSHVQTPGYEFDFPAVEAGLGKNWEVLNIAPRAYPCGHYIQPFIDAALTLYGENEIAVERLSAIECSVADYMIPLICEPMAEKIKPATSWHARYSLPFCLAECLLKGSFTKYSLGVADLEDERYLSLARKVTYRPDPKATDRAKWSGEVTLVYDSGERLHHRVEHMRGTPQNPMTQEDLVQKFFHNASGVLAQDVANRIVREILQIENVKNIRSIFSPLSSVRMGAERLP
jgi:2-methylcitrate dehydratase PrpD